DTHPDSSNEGESLSVLGDGGQGGLAPKGFGSARERDGGGPTGSDLDGARQAGSPGSAGGDRHRVSRNSWGSHSPRRVVPRTRMRGSHHGQTGGAAHGWARPIVGSRFAHWFSHGVASGIDFGTKSRGHVERSRPSGSRARNL